MLTVACVLRSGSGDYDHLSYDRHEPKAPPASTYVRALEAGVHDYLEVEHRIVCLTDRPEWCRWPGSYVEPIALEHDWPGWWSKMELFRLPGPLLYLDLDTVIVGDITPLANALQNGLFGRDQVGFKRDGLMMIRDFNSGLPQSGLLGWGNSMRLLYDEFVEDARGAAWTPGKVGPSMRANGISWRGDGEWLRSHGSLAMGGIRLAQDVMPGIVSYKRDVRAYERLSDESRIVCFHGRPRPHEVNPQPAWLREYWGGDA